MERHPTRELLDTDAGTAQEVAESLRDLRWFNRWFGGLGTSREMMEKVVRETRSKSFSVLEIASGEGFLPRLLSTEFERSGIHLDFTLLDRVLAHLPTNGSAAKLVGDACQLPFPNAAFDLVASSLFVHHLAPEDVVIFLREALRVCRIAVLVNDLIRHPFHLALAHAGKPLYRSRITRNDAPASVWQAYTVEEIKVFLERAGCSRVEIRRHYLYRMGVIAWKSPEPAA